MRRRSALQQEMLSKRIEDARSVAAQAADWLKKTYDIRQVWLFGSLVQASWFTPTSDIDLAIEQLPPGDYLMAVAKLQDISPDFKIDLVQLKSIPPSFKAAILAEGRLL